MDRIFAPIDDRIEIPPAFEFPLRPSTTLRDLHEFYGVQVEGPLDLTLPEVLRRELSEAQIIPGRQIQIGPPALRICGMNRDGTIETVGMSIRSELQVPQCERSATIHRHRPRPSRVNEKTSADTAIRRILD